MSQVIAHSGGPVNWPYVAVAGTASGGTSTVLSRADSVPGADYVLPPGPKGMARPEQAWHFGVRTDEGILNVAGRNTQGMLAGAGMGAIVGGPESPGVVK